MSTLGHVSFLLPFSRDFVCCGCITSFLTRSETRRRRKSATGETSRREKLMQHATRGHSLKGHSLNGHSLKGHSLKGHSLKGHSLKGHSL